MSKKTRDCAPVNGILLIDKPRGMTSNRVLQEVKRHFNACKAGHTGSLDPLATGLLPICLGEATKISRFLLDADKHYWVEIELGQETTTYDAEGEIIATRPVTVGQAEVEPALRSFVGNSEQIPPMYSAIKQQGQPLYKRARAGLSVERAARKITVHELKLLKLQQAKLEIAVFCGKGTYIRSLAHDLGQLLGCGAHVTQLRRLAIGGFSAEQAVDLAALKAMDHVQCLARLIPIDRAIMALPAVYLAQPMASALRHGQSVFIGGQRAAGWVRLYEEQNGFLGVGQFLADGRIAPKRLLAVPETSAIGQ
ncbi:MAG TPA: tRNA pseudouridine(55) synthase TruB [Acidiferrobacterales bacterium]|nr:tRNA pseudouridine(55) synthase TruB [Acidiferrobacterales bacterium]